MNHWLLAVGILGVALAEGLLVWSACIYWHDWREDRALRAAEARHSHRKGGPVETTLLEPRRDLQPPPWHFAGESEQGWAAESAEYELLTQTAELPEPVPGVDTPSDFIDSMTAEVDEMVAEYARMTNVWIHSIPRVILEQISEPQAAAQESLL